MGEQSYIFTSILFIKSKLKRGIFVPFCNSEILFHQISVKWNTVLYDPGSFIILEPIPPFLFKVSNLELYFGIFL